MRMNNVFDYDALSFHPISIEIGNANQLFFYYKVNQKSVRLASPGNVSLVCDRRSALIKLLKIEWLSRKLNEATEIVLKLLFAITNRFGILTLFVIYGDLKVTSHPGHWRRSLSVQCNT